MSDKMKQQKMASRLLAIFIVGAFAYRSEQKVATNQGSTPTCLMVKRPAGVVYSLKHPGWMLDPALEQRELLHLYLAELRGELDQAPLVSFDGAGVELPGVYHQEIAQDAVRRSELSHCILHLDGGVLD